MPGWSVFFGEKSIRTLKLFRPCGVYGGMSAVAQSFPSWQMAAGAVSSAIMSETASNPVTKPETEARAAVDEDAPLMLAVGRGDEAALVALIERWQRPLINFFYRSLHNYSESEDLAQVTFIRLHRAAVRYEPTAKFSTYLFQIARRLLINEYRRRSRKPLEVVDPADLHAVQPGGDERRRGEIEEAFAYALEGLPENHRSAILLYQQQGLSYQEIAVSMDATESAVKTWIFRARTQLRAQLKDLL